MPGHRLPLVLATATDAMTVLGVHPLRFEADPAGASMIAVMPSAVLYQRSRGPYRAERPPPEAVRLAELISLRYGGRIDRPELDLDLDLDARWARLRLTMRLPTGTVRITFVVPEDAPPGWQPPAGDVTVPIGLKIALEAIAGSVQGLGADVPMSVVLSYPSGSPPGLPGLPVVPTLDLDRQAMPPEVRKRHGRLLESMPGIRAGGGLLRALGRRRFEVWSGVVRIRDAG
jgi:hypothetical protein